VALLSKVHPIRSHSGAAQGGINAALGKNDSWEAHAFDTVKGSDYLADQDSVDILCKEAPGRIADLDRFGTLFSRTPEGDIAQRPFGGAGFPRTCYAADRTGHHLLHTMYQQCLRNGLRVLEEWFVLKLVVSEKAMLGLVAYHIPTGEVVPFKSRVVILATGGYGRIYSKSTNAIINTGDGAALAVDAGAQLMDMEFVQFHPTTLRGTNILISEAARGEGGYLKNKHGERFMSRYAKDAMELAPRDIVARSIQTEIDQGRGFDNDYIQLDLTHLGRDRIKSRLPGIRQISMDFAGVDPIAEPIPIQPGQHYSMGGIEVDNQCKAAVDGLLSAGESACVSVHGANRLGGNSLLETLVFGKVAGETARAHPHTGIHDEKRLETTAKIESERIEDIKGGSKQEPMAALRTEMKDTMTACFGVFRQGDRMAAGLTTIRDIRKRYMHSRVGDHGKEFNQAIVNHKELGNMLTAAEAVAMEALAREESRGSHSRMDFPNRDDSKFLRHSIVSMFGDTLRLSYKPVRLGRYPVKERVY